MERSFHWSEAEKIFLRNCIGSLMLDWSDLLTNFRQHGIEGRQSLINVTV